MDGRVRRFEKYKKINVVDLMIADVKESEVWTGHKGG